MAFHPYPQHPLSFQPKWVRSSTPSYRRFNLAMGRSLSFGSWSCDSTALFGLAFATATPPGLTSPHNANSQAHSSKGTQSRHTEVHDAPTACRHTVSGTLSLPPGYFSPFPHGTSPLSVTREYSGLGGGPPRFTRNFTGSVLLGIPLGRYGRFRLRDCYPLWCAFPCASTNPVLCHSPTGRQSDLNGPTTPNTQRLPALTRARFSLFHFRSPLLAESRLLSLPVGNEMFHFPTFPPRT